MAHPDSEHGLRIQLATASALADEWRAKANQLLALCGRLESNLTEARAGRENWKEACRKTEQERDSRDWTGLKSERDALRGLVKTWAEKSARQEASFADLRADVKRLREALGEALEWILGEGSIVPERLVGRIKSALAGGGDRG